MPSTSLWIAPLLSLLGVMAGASLQYYFSRSTEARKQLMMSRTTAYVDFIRATAGIALYQRRGNAEKEDENIALMTDAKTRIAVYGSKPVVEALAAFWRGGAALNSPERLHAFVVVCQRMREDSTAKEEPVLDKELSQLLFGAD